VNVSDLIARGKAAYKKTGRYAVRDHWMARPSLVGKLSSSTSWLTNAVINLKPSCWAMSSLMHITPRRKLPEYAADPLRAGQGLLPALVKLCFSLGAFFATTSPQSDARSNCSD
jgi:glycerol-3-phosphate dehydrogenase subunit C